MNKVLCYVMACLSLCTVFPLCLLGKSTILFNTVFLMTNFDKHSAMCISGNTIEGVQSTVRIMPLLFFFFFFFFFFLWFQVSLGKTISQTPTSLQKIVWGYLKSRKHLLGKSHNLNRMPFP